MLQVWVIAGCGSDDGGSPELVPTQVDPRAELLVSADGGAHRVRPDGSSRLLLRGADRAQWSRDGQRIARLEDGPDPSDYGGRVPELVTSRPDGSGRVVMRLRRDFGQRYRVEDFSWGPDGRLAVIAVTAGGEEPPHRLFVVRPDGSQRREPRRCREIGSVSWSPDGRRIAYSCRSESLEVVAPDGAGRRALPGGQGSLSLGFVARITWRPDGRILAIDAQDINNDERMAFVPSARGRWRPGPRASSLSWSPDGRLIAYTPITVPAGVVIADAVTGRRLRFIALKGAYDVQWRPRSPDRP